MSLQVNITSVEFTNYKTFKNYILRLHHMNILVGPNNSGKSTIINTFRILDIAIRQARSKKASLIDGPNGKCFGYPIPEESIPTSLENVHTEYDEVDTFVTFKLSNNNKLILYFPNLGGCYLITDANGIIINSPSAFKKSFPIDITIIPVLGPIEYNEIILSEQTIKQGLSTHRASRHFRNYWYYYPYGFEKFSELIRKTWPGMDILPPERKASPINELAMYCLENRLTREIYWSGFGFQIWCQLLTHISRSSDSTILIVDEPEIYLHPDVQRQLLNILRYTGPDILIATHSTEIMGEADITEILMIDKNKRSAERLRDIEGLQTALDIVGSVQNITLTQLARTKRILFVEGPDDFRILRRFARQLGYSELASGFDITPIESGGFSSWERIRSLAWGFQSILNSKIHIGAIFDRDYWCDEEVSSILEELQKHIDLSHIHLRKEIENYLLNLPVLERALIKAIIERTKRSDLPYSQPESIISIIDRLTIPLKSNIQGQYIAKQLGYLKQKNPKLDIATITSTILENFNDKWNDMNLRMYIVPGKEILRLLRAEIKNKYSVNLTDFKLIDEFKSDEIPTDLKDLLEFMEIYRKS